MKLENIKLIVENTVGLNISKKTRRRDYLESRWIYFSLSREFTTKSLSSIGNLLNQDHATVLHGLSQIELVKKQSEFLANNYSKCRNTLIRSIKNDFKEVEDIDILKKQYNDILDLTRIDYDLQIKELKNQLKESKKQTVKDIKNQYLLRLLNSTDSIINEVCETRLKTFFMMLDSRKTHEDILSKRKKSIYG